MGHDENAFMVSRPSSNGLQTNIKSKLPSCWSAFYSKIEYEGKIAKNALIEGRTMTAKPTQSQNLACADKRKIAFEGKIDFI